MSALPSTVLPFGSGMINSTLVCCSENKSEQNKIYLKLVANCFLDIVCFGTDESFFNDYIFAKIYNMSFCQICTCSGDISKDVLRSLNCDMFTNAATVYEHCNDHDLNQIPPTSEGVCFMIDINNSATGCVNLDQHFNILLNKLSLMQEW